MNIVTKICKKCGVEKPASDFYDRYATCKACQIPWRRKYTKEHKSEKDKYNKQYHVENADKRCSYQRDYYQQHKEERAAYNKGYYQKFKDTILLQVKKWAKE